MSTRQRKLPAGCSGVSIHMLLFSAALSLIQSTNKVRSQVKRVNLQQLSTINKVSAPPCDAQTVRQWCFFKIKVNFLIRQAWSPFTNYCIFHLHWCSDSGKNRLKNNSKQTFQWWSTKYIYSSTAVSTVSIILRWAFPVSTTLYIYSTTTERQILYFFYTLHLLLIYVINKYMNKLYLFLINIGIYWSLRGNSQAILT